MSIFGVLFCIYSRRVRSGSFVLKQTAKANHMENKFTRADIAALLSEVAAEYTAKGGPPVSVVIHGGASATLRHDFRKTTHDIDYALLEPSSLFADCVASVGQRHALFPRWMHPMPQFSEMPRYRENFRRHVEPLTGFLTGTDGTVSFSAQDDAWLIVHSLYFFRRYNGGRASPDNTGGVWRGYALQLGRGGVACGPRPGCGSFIAPYAA